MQYNDAFENFTQRQKKENRRRKEARIRLGASEEKVNEQHNGERARRRERSRFSINLKYNFVIAHYHQNIHGTTRPSLNEMCSPFIHYDGHPSNATYKVTNVCINLSIYADAVRWHAFVRKFIMYIMKLFGIYSNFWQTICYSTHKLPPAYTHYLKGSVLLLATRNIFGCNINIIGTCIFYIPFAFDTYTYMKFVYRHCVSSRHLAPAHIANIIK